MAEKLSITIFLDGAAEIERQLQGISKEGVKAFQEIAKAAEQVGGFQQIDPTQVMAALKKFGVTGAAEINKITAAVAQAGRLEGIVRGIRQVEMAFAGVGVAAQRVTGAFTAIATAAASTGGAVGRLARSLGLIGGGAIAGSLGALALGMEKTADSARVLEGNLQALFRNQQAGTQFFNQIQNAAQTAGASLESTAKTMVGIVQAIQQALQARGFRFAPGEGLKQATVDAEKFFDTLQKGMKLSGARSEEANTAIAALFNEIRTNGALTGDTLRKFAAEFPQLANELVKFLGIPGESMEQLATRVDRGLKRIDITAFTNAVKRATPEIQKLSDAFDPTLAQRMDTIAGAWDRLLNSFGKSPAGAKIKAAMDDIAKGLDEIAKKQEQVGKFTVTAPPTTTTGKLLQQTFDEFNQNIEIAKKNWETLKRNVSDPIKLAFVFANLNPAVLAINKVIEGIQQLRALTQKKITVPFEADPEPPWVQAYLQFIERIKVAFAELVTKPVANAWTWLVTTLNAAVAGFPAALQRGAAIISTLVTTAVGGAWQWIVDTLRGVIGQIPQLAQSAVAAITAFVTTGVGGAWQWIVTTFNSVVAQIPALAQSAIAAINTFVMTGVSGAWQWILNTLSGVIGQIPGLAQSAVAAVTSLVTTPIANAWQWIIDKLKAVIAQIPGLGSALGMSGGGQVGGFQSGGQVGGRGTGTSDSNLVRVSRGEYIVPARAVRQPGVLSFLEALRHSGGRLQDIIDDMGRFALGGLVPRAIPAFAAGGLTGGSMSNVTIQFPGLPEITGLRAPEKVVDELRKAAALAQVRSGGRKPSRYT